MVKGGLRSLSEGFPVKTGAGGVKLHHFWTNFSPRHITTEILEKDPDMPGYWQFTTTLDADDLLNYMPHNAIIQFLYKMYEFYGRAPNQA